MPKRPEEWPEQPATDPALADDALPLTPAWEQEIDRFWQNVTFNVSPNVSTTIHNFLHDEKEALKARLKHLF